MPIYRLKKNNYLTLFNPSFSKLGLSMNLLHKSCIFFGEGTPVFQETLFGRYTELLELLFLYPYPKQSASLKSCLYDCIPP